MESKLRAILANFFESLELNIVEERVVNYLIRELRNGRRLSSILKDPYITNRLPEERLHTVLENKEVIAAMEEEISQAFIKDFDFFDSQER